MYRVTLVRYNTTMSERPSDKASSAEFYQEIGSEQKYLAILETVAETEDATTEDGSLGIRHATMAFPYPWKQIRCNL